MLKKEVVFWWRDYERFREVGLTERQIADLLGIKSIPVLRMVKFLVRHYLKTWKG